MSTRYRFYATPGPLVVCVSSYAGKPVRATAKCSENDEYDLEKGKELAQARVDAKIAKLRERRATQKREEAYRNLVEAQRRFEKMVAYQSDAVTERLESESALIDLENSL